jgi:uncharacterized protein (DUF4415 family)
MRTAKQKAAELQLLAAKPEDEIDTSDIPEVMDWSGSIVGKFYRPIKKQVTLRIDADVLDWFRGRDEKYQTAVNKALREHMLRERKAG